MTSKERTIKSVNHETPDRIPLDMGGTGVTGVHARIVELLRAHYGLEARPVKAIEPYQMLGEIDQELLDAIGVDVVGVYGKNNMFGIPQDNWKEYTFHWGQTILVPGNFNPTTDESGSTFVYPEGDQSLAPTAKMPKDSYFFDALIRQDQLDEGNLKAEDNLEEFAVWSEVDVAHWKNEAARIKDSDRFVVASFGGTAIGDIALVPAMNLRHPKGIRDVAEWYMSTLIRRDLLHEIFEKQTDIALINLQTAWDIFGDTVNGLFICGTDFGTQNSTFCSPDDYSELYHPYYKKMNDWIHQHTSWKTFKHSCGAVESLMTRFIDSGFDIINPVQINATGMDPRHLKKEYGKHLVFWGGGVDTQKVLPFGSPDEVRKQVLETCEIFSEGGGFVFNTVHNIQANTPIENVVAMLEALKEFNGRG